MRVMLFTLLAVLAVAAPARAEDRIDRAAEGLQDAPLYVHPELAFLVPERDRELILQHLRDTYVPFDVRIAVLPSVQADENGGDFDRALWAIDDRLSKGPRLLIGVDQRGNFTLVQARSERDLDVPFEIEYGPREGSATKTIVPRLRAVFQLAARAQESDYVYQRERPTDPLDPLPEDRPDAFNDSDDDGSPAWLVLLGTGIAGAFSGLLGWILSLAFRWGRRRA